MKYIIGADLGTSNTKVVAYTTGGRVLASAAGTVPVHTPQEGYHEIDAVVVFDQVLDLLSDIVQRLPSHTPAGVCFSAAMHGLMAVDGQGQPLTRLMTWADLRSRDYAASLKHTELGRRIYQRTGTPIHPMSPLCKLMWMKAQQPDVFGKASRFISLKEYIFFRLFGEYVIDHSLASATGLFDVFTLDWNQEALSVAGIGAERLSAPVPVLHQLSGMQQQYADRCGIDRQIPFIAGASDGCLAHLGSNALSRHDLSLTIGTSAAVRITGSQPLHDPQQRIFNYILDSDQYVSGGPLNNGGNILQWFAAAFLKQQSFQTSDIEAFLQAAFEAPPGCGGLIFLPYLYGERAPVWDAHARGVFFGIRPGHTERHFMRAVLEGIAFALRQVVQTLEELTGPANRVYVSGGVTRSPLWVSLLSDVLQKPLSIMQAEDASAAGAAIMGMKSLGIIHTFEEAACFFSVQQEFHPAEESYSLYQDNYTVYTQLYERLRDLFPETAERAARQ